MRRYPLIVLGWMLLGSRGWAQFPASEGMPTPPLPASSFSSMPLPFPSQAGPDPMQSLSHLPIPRLPQMPQVPLGTQQVNSTPPPAAAPQPAADSKTADQEPSENLRTFQEMMIEITWTNMKWQLTVDGTVLKEFGGREMDARQALRVIQDLRLNTWGTIGRPYPVMEYWLSDGQAPQTLPAGMRLLAFDPESLHVEEIQKQWCVRDKNRVLFNFGPRGGDARLAVNVVQKYGFTHIGLIGQGAPTMMVFLSRPGVPGGNHLGKPVNHVHKLSPGLLASRMSARSDKEGDRPLADPLQTSFGVHATPILPALRGVTHAPQGMRKSIGHGSLQEYVARQIPFARQTQALPGLEEMATRVPFDWRQVKLRQDQGSWKLMLGGYVFADFGNNAEAARVGFAAIHFYRFTEQCLIGTAESRLSYYLVNGQAPQGVLFGLPNTAFQPESVTIQQLGNGYVLCSGNQVLMQFGERGDEARQMLEAIQRHKFDRLCRLGGTDGAAGMTFLVRSR